MKPLRIVALPAAALLALTLGACADGTLTLSGTVECTGYDVQALSAGQVAQVLVQEGDQVKSGDVLARVDDGSGYGTFVGPLVVTGFAVGLSVAPCTATIMGNFPEADLGVGGGVNNTSLQVGGALGIAIFGSLLATSYESDLGSSAVAQQLPGQAMDVAKESIGTAQAVAQQVGATAGPQAAQALVRAADHAFNQAMSHTASIGGVILAVGAVVVAIILPRRRSAADQRRPGGGEQLGESQPAVRAGN